MGRGEGAGFPAQPWRERRTVKRVCLRYCNKSREEPVPPAPVGEGPSSPRAGAEWGGPCPPGSAAAPASVSSPGWRRATGSFWSHRGACRRSGSARCCWSSTWRRCAWSPGGRPPREQLPGAEQVGLGQGPRAGAGRGSLAANGGARQQPPSENAGSRGSVGGPCLPLLPRVVPWPPSQSREPQSAVAPGGPGPAHLRALSRRWQ